MSKYRIQDRPALVKHRHCSQCGAPVDMDKTYCGKKCQEDSGRLAKRKRRTFLLTMIIPLGLLAMLYLFAFLSAP